MAKQNTATIMVNWNLVNMDKALLQEVHILVFGQPLSSKTWDKIASLSHWLSIENLWNFLTQRFYWELLVCSENNFSQTSDV